MMQPHSIRNLSQGQASSLTIAVCKSGLSVEFSHKCCWLGRDRHANRFLALHGVPRLAAALALERPGVPAGAVRQALAACEALCLSCGCAGVEALLGWWRPPQADYAGDEAQARAFAFITACFPFHCAQAWLYGA